MNNTNNNGDTQSSGKSFMYALVRPRSPAPQDGVDSRKNSWMSVIIAVVAVIVVAIITTVVVIEDYKRDMENMTAMQQPSQNAEDAGVLLNGEQITFRVIRENGKTYFPVDELTKVLNYGCVVENGLVRITTSKETYVLEAGSTTVNITYHVTSTGASTSITTAPFVSDDGRIYVYVRDLAFFMKDANVSYDSENQLVVINITPDFE